MVFNGGEESLEKTSQAQKYSVCLWARRRSSAAVFRTASANLILLYFRAFDNIKWAKSIKNLTRYFILPNKCFIEPKRKKIRRYAPCLPLYFVGFTMCICSLRHSNVCTPWWRQSAVSQELGIRNCARRQWKKNSAPLAEQGEPKSTLKAWAFRKSRAKRRWRQSEL